MATRERVGRNSIAAASILSLFLLAGCAGMSDTEKRVGGGTVGGAALGAAAGAIGGNAALGAGIGAGVGLVGGYLYDKYKKSEEAAYQKGKADAQKQQQQK